MQGALISKHNSRLYLETYLIDTSVTKKSKKVSEKTIDDNVLKSRGHPLTLYPKQHDNSWIWDHPVIETNSLSDNIELQKKYTIGHEVRLKKVKDGYWNAVYEITDEGAKKLFGGYEGKTIPFYTSTGIIHSSNEDPLDITDWRIIHNAIVSQPANGFERAAMVDMCQGTEQTCQSILTASLSKDIPFCTTAALQNYISSLASSTSNFSHYTMSSETTAQVSLGEKTGAINYNPGFSGVNAQTGTGTVPNSLTPSSPPDAFKQQQQEQKTETKEETVDYKSIADQLKAELKQLKSEKESKEAENKTVTERLANLERENARNSRKNQVFSILQQYPEAFQNKDGQIDQQAYSKTVLEWIDKGYDDKTIQELLEAKVIKVKNAMQSKTNDQLKQVYSSLTTPDYQTTTMTTASIGNQQDSSLPIWEQVFDLTNARIKNAAEKYQKSGGRY